MNDGFDCLSDQTFHGLEAMETKAEVLMEAAIEQMEEIARDLVDCQDPPIAVELRLQRAPRHSIAWSSNGAFLAERA